VAILVGEHPTVFQVDAGASGYYGYEVMDTCRPTPDGEAGDAELSLTSYLHCCEQAFLEYQRRVAGADYRHTFQYLVFHTPFGGMIRGAHRTMMRQLAGASRSEIEADFQQRVLPGLTYCQRVGNIMGATLFLALAGTIDQVRCEVPQRIGCFSYGSGCCSEFYSGVVTPQSRASLQRGEIARRLDQRYQLSMDEYEAVVRSSGSVKFGTRDVTLDFGCIAGVPASYGGQPHLVLQAISDYHRHYTWLS
jgi:polyketide biosynthesis 3-hydroxy-3-methylglutaryl-CoA synthase-like enzyme PksG